jgi:predicted ATPase
MSIGRSREAALRGERALVEQSLVAVQPPKDGGESRYGMLEPVTQYALEKLEESGEAGMVGHSHAAFFLALAERAYPEVLGERQVEWLERLEQEYGNLRAAMSWALDADDGATSARIGWTLWYFWWARSYHREGRRWMEEYSSVLFLRPCGAGRSSSPAPWLGATTTTNGARGIRQKVLRCLSRRETS